MKYKKIGDDWNKIYRGTIITLKSPKTFGSFDGNIKLVKGDYKILGFYANAVKLKRNRKEYFIASGRLREFYRKTKNETSLKR